MKKVLNNIRGIDIVTEKYLNKNGIPYEVFTFDDELNNHLKFENISMLIHDDSVLVDCRINGIIYKDEESLKQIKKYLHKCNHENGLVWFDLHEQVTDELNITCSFSNFFTDINIEAVLIECVKEIKKFIEIYVQGLKDIALLRTI